MMGRCAPAVFAGVAGADTAYETVRVLLSDGSVRWTPLAFASGTFRRRLVTLPVGPPSRWGAGGELAGRLGYGRSPPALSGPSSAVAPQVGFRDNRHVEQINTTLADGSNRHRSVLRAWLPARALGLFVLLRLLVSCGDACTPVSKSTYLKDLATDRDVTIGTLYNYGYSHPGYDDSAIYNRTITDEFHTISLEFEFAMDEIWVDPAEYVYTYLDHALEFARTNGLRVKGTHLVWHAQTPDWLVDGFANGTYVATEVSDLTQDYITALFAHITSAYPGIVESVNVVNEVIRDDYDADDTYAEFRNTLWREALGPDFVARLLSWTATASEGSGIRLVVNDYGIELPGPKKDRFDVVLSSLQTLAAPIDAVGLQCHFSIHDIIDDPFDEDDFVGVLDSYADRGFDIELTEIDVRINDDRAGRTDSKLAQQAALFGRVVTAALRNPNVVGIHFWGFNDDLSYLNGHAEWLSQRRDWGLLFDSCYRPKPAYFAVADALRE